MRGGQGENNKDDTRALAWHRRGVVAVGVVTLLISAHALAATPRPTSTCLGEAEATGGARGGADEGSEHPQTRRLVPADQERSCDESHAS